MRRPILTAILTAVFAAGLSAGSALACDTNADTEEGSAMNAVQYAETVVHWHEIRKVASANGDVTVLTKHTQAADALASAQAMLDAGDWAGASKQAYRVPEILHY